MRDVVCNLCGSAESVLLYKNAAVTYVRCTRCTFVYLNPRLDTTALRNFYTTGYQESRHQITTYEAAVARMKEPGRYDKKRVRAEELKDFLTKDSRVLEVGAGYGMLLSVIEKRYGCQVEGVESAAVGSRVAREYFKLPIHTQSFEDFLREKNGDGQRTIYDLVILVHVLEHFEDPKAMLSAIKTLLTAQGQIYIAVPNIMKLDEPPTRFFHSEHLSYFSPYTLVRMLHEVGFAAILLEERERELVVRAVLKEAAEGKKIISAENYQLKNTPEAIEIAIRSYREKYKYLKKVVRAVLPALPSSLHPFVRRIGIWVGKNHW